MIEQFKRQLLAISVSLNFLFGIIYFTPLTEMLYRPLIVDETPLPSELIVVLSSGAYPDGLPNFRTHVRLRKAVELFHKGFAPAILTLGGGWKSAAGLSFAEVMREELAEYYQVPRNQLLSHSETSNTFDDITSMLKRFKGQFDFNKVIFVSSSYHTYRIKKILEKKGLFSKVVAAPAFELTPILKIDRVDHFWQIGREYLAILYFRLAGWI